MTRTRDHWAGVRALTLMSAVVVLAILVAIHFEAELHKVNWPLVALLCGFAGLAWAAYLWNAHESTYNFVDMFTRAGKADLWAHMVIVFAAISGWVVVKKALDGSLTTEMLSLVLGIFVGKEAVGQIAVAISNRPPATNLVAPGAAVINQPAAPVTATP